MQRKTLSGSMFSSTPPGKTHPFRKVLTLLSIPLLLGSFSLGSTKPAVADEGESGNVYAMTNASQGNQVMAFRRNSNGSLVLLGTFATNGKGSGPGFVGPSDPLGAQGSLVLHKQWLFAVNAGSNDISVFRVQSNGLTLINKVSSQGKYPVSIAVKGNLLYVLNSLGDAQGLGSIAGFEIQKNGYLTPLLNTIRTLNTASDATPIAMPPDGTPPDAPQQPNILNSPSQISFSPKGDQLVITDKGVLVNRGLIHVFRLNEGNPSETPVDTVTSDPGPFGFIFDRQGKLVVTGVINGGITTYTLNSNGTVTDPVHISNEQTQPSLTCWIASTGNGRYLYVANNANNNLSAYERQQAGFRLLKGPSFPIQTGTNSNPSDVTISNRYLYSVSSGIGAINMFRINSDGSLTSLGDFTTGLPLQGAAGLTSR